MCGSRGYLEMDGQLQILYPPKAKLFYEKKLDCSAECREAWPEKEMKSACTHLNTNRKSKHYDQAVPCGHKWDGNKLRELEGGVDEACAVDVRTW